MNIPKNEYGEFYSGYIELSNGLPLNEQLIAQKNEVVILIETLSDEDALYRYDEGKWTIKEIFGHLLDTERIFCYRALAIARGEEKSLPGYDQDIYVKNAKFNDFGLHEIKDQYLIARKTTLQIFSGFDDEVMMKKGIVNGMNFTVRALGYVIAGHEHHHLNILAERYLPGLT
ncbi:MAG: DinB family protein [Balneolaceae bacterium]